MRNFSVVTILVLVAITGCTVVDFGPGDQNGPVTGSLATSPSQPRNENIVVSVTGASLGNLLSARVKEKLNQRDRENVDNAADRSFREGKRTEWANSQSGRHGYIEPGRVYKTASGELCRDFTNTILYKGREDVVSGRACQGEDGTWRIVN